MVLFNEQPIVINKELAKKIGLNEAIVLQQLHYWIENNKKSNRNYKEGYYWTYNSVREWQENEFIFWSTRTIQRIFKSLEEKNLLISGNFNKDKRDKTKWYTINYSKLNSDYYGKCIMTTCRNGDGQNDVMDNDKMAKPLPENYTENYSKTYYNTIFEKYLAADIVKHQSLTKVMKESIKKSLKKYKVKEILCAIERYSTMYHDNEYPYCSYKWTLNELLTREKGIAYFLDEGDKWISYQQFKQGKKIDSNKPKDFNFDYWR